MKSLTVKEIDKEIEEDPNNTMFDNCHICGGIFEDHSLKLIAPDGDCADDCDGFELACPKCRPDLYKD